LPLNRATALFDGVGLGIGGWGQSGPSQGLASRVSRKIVRCCGRSRGECLLDRVGIESFSFGMLEDYSRSSALIIPLALSH